MIIILTLLNYWRRPWSARR